MEKAKYQSTDNTKTGIKNKKEKLSLKNRGLQMKDKNKLKEHMETSFISFDSQGGLFQSEDNKCINICN